MLRAEAGVSHTPGDALLRPSAGFAGLEFGAGHSRARVGGWIAMNAGIPDREVKDVVRELEVMAPTRRRDRHLDRAALRFVYRGAARPRAGLASILSALLRS